MDAERPEIRRAAEQLAAQLDRCHGHIMAIFKYAEDDTRPEVQLRFMQAATRMMQAASSAAAVLQRLRGETVRHTFTYLHAGVPPTPRKSKTNGHRPPDAALPANGRLDGDGHGDAAV